LTALERQRANSTGGGPRHRPPDWGSRATFGTDCGQRFSLRISTHCFKTRAAPGAAPPARLGVQTPKTREFDFGTLLRIAPRQLRGAESIQSVESSDSIESRDCIDSAPLNCLGAMRKSVPKSNSRVFGVWTPSLAGGAAPGAALVLKQCVEILKENLWPQSVPNVALDPQSGGLCRGPPPVELARWRSKAVKIMDLI
jgi:hypothetical protein